MNDREERLGRIGNMERIYDQASQSVAELMEAAQKYADLQASIRDLEAYYRSPLWREDFYADQNGEISQDVKRGILSEDAIYDLLMEEGQMLDLLKKISENS